MHAHPILFGMQEKGRQLPCHPSTTGGSLQSRHPHCHGPLSPRLTTAVSHDPWMGSMCSDGLLPFGRAGIRERRLCIRRRVFPSVVGAHIFHPTSTTVWFGPDVGSTTVYDIVTGGVSPDKRLWMPQPVTRSHPAPRAWRRALGMAEKNLDSARQLFRDCLRLADYLSTRQGSREALRQQVRLAFRKNLDEKDPEKIEEHKEACVAMRGGRTKRGEGEREDVGARKRDYVPSSAHGVLD